jgi:hypothetical protein
MIPSTHSVVNGIAGQDDSERYRARAFSCRRAVNFISNDSDTGTLLCNFDAPVGSAGTIILRPGEAMSDLFIACRQLYAQGMGADVPFRAVGS